MTLFGRISGYLPNSHVNNNPEVVNTIQKNSNQLKGLNIIRKIKNIMAEISKIKIMKINREAKNCGDSLTKLSLNLYYEIMKVYLLSRVLISCIV